MTIIVRCSPNTLCGSTTSVVSCCHFSYLCCSDSMSHPLIILSFSLVTPPINDTQPFFKADQTETMRQKHTDFIPFTTVTA